MMSKDCLKPCPFCGNEDVELHVGDFVVVSCSCGVRLVDDYDTIAVWNKRVSEPMVAIHVDTDKLTQSLKEKLDALLEEVPREERLRRLEEAGNKPLIVPESVFKEAARESGMLIEDARNDQS